ncbi:MAG: hypothetical protein L0Y60_03510 [Beijerinckiaceae bacterium]|nr:hypothetical protein [Beijerinckiaceae bacterium]
MTIVRREHRAHFTIVPNAMFLDKRLSIEAKGVLGSLLSRPHKWQVQLDHVGRTLRIGRKKLQRIFRELISTGYVTREQRRILDDQRFGEMDYVVRDVPELLSRSVDNSPSPRGQNGTAAPRVRKEAAYKETPQGQKGPAYKELLHKNESYSSSSMLHAEGWPRLPVEKQQLPRSLEDAHYDAGIVTLFDDVAEGWELLSVIPSETLTQ